MNTPDRNLEFPFGSISLEIAGIRPLIKERKPGDINFGDGSARYGIDPSRTTSDGLVQLDLELNTRLRGFGVRALDGSIKARYSVSFNRIHILTTSANCVEFGDEYGEDIQRLFAILWEPSKTDNSPS